MRIFLIVTFAFVCPAFAADFDVYESYSTKGSFCTVTGGACAADTDFDSGFFQNPASLAGEGATFDFDFDFDIAPNPDPEIGTAATDASTLRSSLGALGWASEKWGIAISMNQQIRTVDSSVQVAGGMIHENVRARETEFHLPMALRLSSKLLVGFTLHAVQAALASNASAGTSLMTENSASPDWSWQFSLGTIYDLTPQWTLGSWIRLPASLQTHQSVVGQAFATPLNFAQDDTWTWPWQWHTGLAWSPQNSKTKYFFQLDILGVTQGGELDSYNALSAKLQNLAPTAKGRELAFEPHLGLRSPVSSGSHWNIYLGSYYESGRVEGASGRVHGTAGLSYKQPLPYHFWDVVEFMAGFDVAHDYDQLILTFR